MTKGAGNLYKKENVLMRNDMERILISEEEIQNKVKELAKELEKEYDGKNPLLVCVLKGAMPFMADLIKEMNIYLEIDFMDVSSYGSATVSSGEVKILKDLDTNVEGRHVLFVEDIIDTGGTLSYLKDMFNYRKAASVKIVTLVDKPTGRKKAIEADWVGFTVPDEFVVGYGLDYIENYRNLPFIGILKPEIYS
nr:hypoxanthine phosphoribosyltransferase [Alkalibacterium sp. MB6]